MLEPLFQSLPFRKLFAAQVVALIGTGLMTVALALLAFDLAPENAGGVLGTALAIKMVAYVGISPFAPKLVARFDRKRVMIAADLVRLALVCTLPFVNAVWQIYGLIFLLQSASAVFTPTFQATIADLFDDEKHYTQALVLSRLAYDLETLLSPLMAAALLLVVSFPLLFAGTAVGFACSAIMVTSATLSASRSSPTDRRSLAGLSLFFKTPRLRGIAALNMVIAAAGAMFLVNTVVFVQGHLGGSEQQTALALAFAGAGSLMAASSIQSLLKIGSDRTIMLAGGTLQTGALFAASQLPPYAGLLALWLAIGFGGGLCLTPIGRVLRRSVAEVDRQAIFSAQFALSHLGWLIAYPLAGWSATTLGLSASALILATVCLLSLAAGAALWPAKDEQPLDHIHDDLPADHPHLADAIPSAGGFRHRHSFVIDQLHHRWPR